MSSTREVTTLSRQWAELKANEPALRIRDAGDRLGVSEAELLAAAMDAPGEHPGLEVRALDRCAELFANIPALGRVMALTRNDAVVSETYGEYGTIAMRGTGATVHNGGIDLRVDFSHWHHAFAVRSESGARVLRSLQFFDCDGTAVHKVYLTDGSNEDAYDELVSRLAASEARRTFEAAASTADNSGGGDADPVELREQWESLGNVHRFTALLKRLDLRRRDALRLIGTDYARPARDEVHRFVLETARESGVPIMIFVRSRGCTQIYSGPIGQLRQVGEYFNVFDPGLHLHIREGLLRDAWVVRKPTSAGIVTAVEVFDAAGELALQFFGIREDNAPEDERWRRIAHACAEASW